MTGVRSILFFAALLFGAGRALASPEVDRTLYLEWDGAKNAFFPTTADHPGRMEVDRDGSRFFRLDHVEVGSSTIQATVDVAGGRFRWLSVTAEVRGQNALGRSGLGYRIFGAGENVLSMDFDYSYCQKALDVWTRCDTFIQVPDDARTLSIILSAPFSSRLDVRSVRMRTVAEEQTVALGDEAKAQVEQVFSDVRSNFFRTAEVDWARVRNTCGPGRIPEGYDPIVPFARCVVRELGDPHSRVYLKAVTSAAFDPATSPHDIRRVDAGTGYAKIATAGVARGLESYRYSQPAREQIRRLLSAGATDWIIDLRGNQGGNVYAMLAAVAPLLGSSREALAYWEYASGRKVPIRLSPRGAEEGAVLHAAIDQADRVPKNVHLAVLIDRSCVSSCEILATILESRACTTLIGQPSGGLNTSIDDFDLRGRYTLALTTAHVLDARGRRRYPNIVPKVVQAGASDAWLSTAQDVLAQAASCTRK